MRLASELGMSLAQVKATTSSSELVLWMTELDQRANDFNPLHFYLASIAAEVRRSYVKHPGRVKVKHLLLNFKAKGKPVPLTDEELAKVTEQAKLKHFKFLGLEADGSPVKVA